MFADGIYLGMSFVDYLADPALGSGDHKDLLVDPVSWHAEQRNPVWRALNPPDEKQTAAVLFGQALHCAVLEPDEFEARYCVEPERPDLPKTKEQIADALRLIGREPPKMSAKSVEFHAAARLHGVRIADDWEAEAEVIAAGRQRISASWHTALTMLQRVTEQHSQARKFITNGRSEVSMFWTDDTGVRCKVRFDYLRTRTVCDVKSYARRIGVGPIEAFCSARDRFAYDVSAAMYMDARMDALPRLVEAGAIFSANYAFDGDPAPLITSATGDDIDFFRQVAAFDDPSWWWLACMTMGYPQVDAIEFPRTLLAFASAQTQVQMARENYRTMRLKFGDDDTEAWIDDRGLVRLTDHNFSMRSTNRGAALWEQG